MEVLELLHAKLNVARRVLRDLLENYQGMEDVVRMGKTTTILDEVNSYLQIKENLIFPYVQRHGEHQDLLARICAVHAEIEDVIEHLLAMHVDEPGGEFYNQMLRLSGLLDLAIKTDEQTIFPWARVYLSDQDQLYIAEHLKNQMVQESLPSSGMTIY